MRASFVEDDVCRFDHRVTELEVLFMLFIVVGDFIFADDGVQLLVDELAFVGVDDKRVPVFFYLLLESELFLLEVVLGLMDQHLSPNPGVDECADTLDAVHDRGACGNYPYEVRLIEILTVTLSHYDFFRFFLKEVAAGQ